MQQLELVSTTFQISSHYSISKLPNKMEERLDKLEETHKRKFSEIDRDLHSLYTIKHELEVDLYAFKRELDAVAVGCDVDVLREEMEDFQEEVEKELKSIRKAMKKMYSLLKLPATPQVEDGQA